MVVKKMIRFSAFSFLIFAPPFLVTLLFLGSFINDIIAIQ